MRLAVPVTVAIVAFLLHRLSAVDVCQLVGHDCHWPTTRLRRCRRCGETWDRVDLAGDIGQTTTTDRTGVW